jgi:multiple sugar transport system substrate-binding protein
VAIVAASAAGLMGASVLATSVLGVASASAASKSAPLVVWIDTARVPYEKAYMKAHPHANIKWVLYNGNDNGTGILESKFSLWNRSGWPSNAPDVMFDTQNNDAVELGTAPYNGLLNLKSNVPAKVLNNFAKGSESACTTPSGAVVCFRNDSAADVLWVNPTLYKQFFGSAPVPTTWAGIIQDGQALNTAHPGYLVGDIGDQFDEDFILWGNECPVNELVGNQKIEINPNSTNCTKIAKMIDSSGDAGKSITTTGVFSSGFDPTKVVMMVGPLWYGSDLFQTGATGSVPNGTMAAYPPPTATNGAHVTGALGGGMWLVSSHTKQPKAAVALAEYMATSPNVQKVGVDAGLPQYVPDEAKYVKSLRSVFADPAITEASWKTAASEVWTGWSPVPWSTDGIWGSTALPNLTTNPPGSFAAQLLPFAEALANQARLAGYTVKSPVSAVSNP